MKQRVIYKASKTVEEEIKPVVLAYEFLEDINTVDLYIFEDDEYREDLYEDLKDNWLDKNVFIISKNIFKISYPLKASSTLCPIEYKIENPESLEANKTKWMGIALSFKVSKACYDSLMEFEDKLKLKTNYSKSIRQELVEISSSIQEKINANHLYHSHAAMLRMKINSLFDELKVVKDKDDQLNEAGSAEKMNALLKRLNDLKQDSNIPQNKKFNELKAIQKDFFYAKLIHKHHSAIWDLLDKAFNESKASKLKNSNEYERLIKRIDGLGNAIKKMENSIQRDEKDLKYNQNKKQKSTIKQFENQILDLKISMIEEKISSKKEKLQDMEKTLSALQKSIKKMDAKIESFGNKSEKK